MGCICNKNHKRERKNNNLIESINRIDEVIIKGKSSINKVDFDTIDKVRKSVCKLKINDNEGLKNATGFFLIYFNQKYLITCNHVLSSDNNQLELEIWNKEIKKFELKNRHSIYMKKPIDAVVFELKNSDDFIESIDFLDYDLNYIKGYSQYKNIEVFSVGYPKGEKLIADSGVIKDINGIEFYHDINTENGSSGSPVILFTTLKVIGIHKQGHLMKNINIGTFFGEILNNINNPQIILNDKLSQQNIIAIEIFDEYKCIINYKVLNKSFKDLGFLIKIPIDKKKFITGFLTKYHIGENILNKINTVILYKNKELLNELEPKSIFAFSDEFLNVTFIEIFNTNFQYIKIFENNKFPEIITLINYSKKQNFTSKITGTFIEKWGTNIKYKTDGNNRCQIDDDFRKYTKLLRNSSAYRLGGRIIRGYIKHIGFSMGIVEYKVTDHINHLSDSRHDKEENRSRHKIRPGFVYYLISVAFLHAYLILAVKPALPFILNQYCSC